MTMTNLTMRLSATQIATQTIDRNKRVKGATPLQNRHHIPRKQATASLSARRAPAVRLKLSSAQPDGLTNSLKPCHGPLGAALCQPSGFPHNACKRSAAKIEQKRKATDMTRAEVAPISLLNSTLSRQKHGQNQTPVDPPLTSARFAWYLGGLKCATRPTPHCHT